MATRSSIGIQHHSGSVTAIYCHWDGYPAYNGQILLDHYDMIKALQLMQLGNLSILHEEIGEKHDFNSRGYPGCTAYGRDRGERDQHASEWSNAEDWFENFGAGAEYFYLMGQDGLWKVRSVYDTDATWKSIELYLNETAKDFYGVS